MAFLKHSVKLSENPFFSDNPLDQICDVINVHLSVVLKVSAAVSLGEGLLLQRVEEVIDAEHALGHFQKPRLSQLLSNSDIKPIQFLHYFKTTLNSAMIVMI